MMSEQVQELGALVIIEGQNAGERFHLRAEQVILGSNPGCQIRLLGKGVSSRAAIIESRNGKYILSSITSEGIEINGVLLGEGKDAELKRGDIIKIGLLKLRFVAPGEVFTLQEGAADRVLDRKPSKLELRLRSIAVILALLCLTALIFYYQSLGQKNAGELTRTREEEKEAERKAAALIAAGDSYYRQGLYTAPSCDGPTCDDFGSCANASECFSKVLKFKPRDSYALGRLREIETLSKSHLPGGSPKNPQAIAKLLTDAQAFYDSGHVIYPPGANAQDTYVAVLALEPENEIAKAKLEEIRERIAKIDEQTQGLLQKAQTCIDKEQFVQPKEENAYDILHQVLSADPENQKAKNALVDIAAYAVYRGDESRKKADAKSMLKWYETAAAVGVDPNYLAPLKRGASLMEHSKSTIIVVDSNTTKSNTTGSYVKGQFLDTAEIIRRVARLQLEDKPTLKSTSRALIDLSAAN